jgi:hypothetical protein
MNGQSHREHLGNPDLAGHSEEMTQQPPPEADDARPGQRGQPDEPGHDHQQHDLEYDLAHEAFDHRSIGPGCERRRDFVPPPVRSDDYDGDYGYDQAHDIPKRHRS